MVGTLVKGVNFSYKFRYLFNILFDLYLPDTEEIIAKVVINKTSTITNKSMFLCPLAKLHNIDTYILLYYIMHNSYLYLSAALLSKPLDLNEKWSIIMGLIIVLVVIINNTLR